TQRRNRARADGRRRRPRSRACRWPRAPRPAPSDRPGNLEGVDVVPVYVNRPVNTGEITTPSNGSLVGWARVDLAARASQQGSVPFPVSQLGVTPGDINGDGRRQVQPGDYQVVLARGVPDIHDPLGRQLSSHPGGGALKRPATPVSAPAPGP